MSYKIKSLTVKNFVVFVDETIIDFSPTNLNQIEAIFKNNPLQSNGAGKSILICAISLALFGKGIRFNHLADYTAPTNPNNDIYVGLDLIDDTGNILKIERWRRANSSTNKAKVWMNSVVVSKDSTNSKVDELIAGYIGVSHSNFLSCIFSVMLPGFLNLRPAQRFEILENALAVKKMESIIKKLNASAKSTEERLLETNASLTEKHHILGQETAKRDIFSQNIGTLTTSIEVQRAELDLLYKEEAILLAKRDEVTKLVDTAETNLHERNKQLTKIESKQFSLENLIENLKSSAKGVLSNLKSSASGQIECLVCHSTLDKSSESEILGHYKSEIADLRSKLAIVMETANLCSTTITKLNTSLVTAKKALAKIDGDLKINLSSAMACEKTIKTAMSSLELAKSAFDSTQLALVTADIETLSKQRDSLQKDVKIILAWKQAMSKNGLRLAYLREEVGTLSAIASKFASSVYAKPTKVEFFIDEDRDNPQLDFTVNGKGAGAFSTGERRMLEIAITLSLMTLLKTAGMNLEFLILDEALDGLSQASKSNVLKIISDLSKDYQVIMISHDEMIKKQPGHIIQVIKDPTTETSTVDVHTR